MSENIVEVHVIVRGDVQGVGFRATVRNYARQHNLKGIVRNMFDGAVEIYAQGSQEDIDRLLAYLKGGAGLHVGHVESVTTNNIYPPRVYDLFNIVTHQH